MVSRMSLDEQVAAYMAKPYNIIITLGDDEMCASACVAELPGCLTCGDTPEEVLSQIRGTMETWIYHTLSLGQTIPEPICPSEIVKMVKNNTATKEKSMDSDVVTQEEIEEAKRIADEITLLIKGESDQGEVTQGRVLAVALALCLGAHIATAPRELHSAILDGIDNLIRETVADFTSRIDEMAEK